MKHFGPRTLKKTRTIASVEQTNSPISGALCQFELRFARHKFPHTNPKKKRAFGYVWRLRGSNSDNKGKKEMNKKDLRSELKKNILMLDDAQWERER